MKGFGKSDIGRVRALNEDSIFVSNTPVGRLPNLYIVADGMGGYKGGEVASSSAISYFCEYAENYQGEDDILDIIVEGVRYANRMIIRDARNDAERLGGMGTTFTALVVNEGKLYLAHVGDSRAYAAGGGSIRQITADHSYVMELVKAGKLTKEEARNHPDKNCITRALGVEDEVLVDGIVNSFDSRFVILCTDGLTNMVRDEEIEGLLLSDWRLEGKAYRLIDEANSRGGYDNISVIVIDREVG
ncbi:MAG: Stp1/IreP family PP2C-type Ser/Thr phosphatase [Clostridiales bacterium]|nr:Stp1/IreP family PP2C-type Ser/Thr phosphatase [Clostridiales bacterium]MCD8214250.1 Stp1/IreP family PP2C-type Ser/Thr phosphatase [Clostridiales bacterium]